MAVLLLLVLQDVVEMKEFASDFLLSRPEAYRDTRSWPLIVHLEPRSEAADRAVARWRDGDHILLVPRRKDLVGERELDFLLACLKEAKGRLRIDPERVFLSGRGEGADLAATVAVREPGLFAACALFGLSRGPEGSFSGKTFPFHVWLVGDSLSKRAGEEAAAELTQAGAKVTLRQGDPAKAGEVESLFRTWFDAQAKPRDSLDAVDEFLAQGRVLDATLEALKLMDREKDLVLVRARLEKMEGAGIMVLGGVEVAFANRKWQDAYLKCRRAASDYAWLPVGEKIRKRLRQLEADPKVKKALGAEE